MTLAQEQRAERNRKIAAEYRAGLSCAELADKFGLSQRSIYAILLVQEVEPRSRRGAARLPLTPEQRRFYMKLRNSYTAAEAKVIMGIAA